MREPVFNGIWEVVLHEDGTVDSDATFATIEQSNLGEAKRHCDVAFWTVRCEATGHDNLDQHDVP